MSTAKWKTPGETSAVLESEFAYTTIVDAAERGLQVEIGGLDVEIPWDVLARIGVLRRSATVEQMARDFVGESAPARRRPVQVCMCAWDYPCPMHIKGED